MNDSCGHASRQRVLIAGAANGVGRACALAFARAGADLVLADHDSQRLSQLAADTRALARFCDVASESSVEIFASEMLGLVPSLNVLVNAAGSGYVRSLGMMRMSRALLPLLRRTEGRKVIANIAPRVTFANYRLFPYAASDGALCRLSEAVALQTQSSSIGVVTVMPGLERARIAQSGALPDERVARFVCFESGEPSALAAEICDLALAEVRQSLPANRNASPLRRAV